MIGSMTISPSSLVPTHTDNESCAKINYTYMLSHASLNLPLVFQLLRSRRLSQRLLSSLVVQSKMTKLKKSYSPKPQNRLTVIAKADLLQVLSA